MDISPALFDAVSTGDLPVVIAVERGDEAGGTLDRDKRYVSPAGTHLVFGPPTAFTALVGQPCETCDEEPGWVLTPHPSGRGNWADECPDCFDGIAPVVLRTRCHVCEIAGRPCVPCQERYGGYRSLSVRVACVPIVDWHRIQYWEPRVTVQGNGRVMVHIAVDANGVIVDPATVALLGNPSDWLDVPHWALVAVEVKR